MKFGLIVLILCIQLYVQTKSQVIPVEFYFPATDLLAVNGSDVFAVCSNASVGPGFNAFEQPICTDPTTSVLLDGIVPSLSLTGSGGEVWARGLLTLNIPNGSLRIVTGITFDFTDVPSYDEVDKVEVVMFNCPQWGVAAQTIRLLGSTLFIAQNPVIITTVNPTATSCNSLVRVCTVDGRLRWPIVTVQFILPPGARWVHVAEVIFYRNGMGCTPNTTTILPTQLPDISGTSTAESSSQDITMATSTSTSMPEANSTTAPEVATSMATNTTTQHMSTTPMATTPMATDASQNPTTSFRANQCEVCVSCSTSTILASVITAILTALLATVVFVVMHIVWHSCRPKSTPAGAETGTSAGEEELVYEEMDGDEGSVAVSDPYYTDIKEGSKFVEVHKNEAYCESIDLFKNDSYEQMQMPQ